MTPVPQLPGLPTKRLFIYILNYLQTPPHIQIWIINSDQTLQCVYIDVLEMSENPKYDCNKWWITSLAKGQWTKLDAARSVPGTSKIFFFWIIAVCESDMDWECGMKEE